MSSLNFNIDNDWYMLRSYIKSYLSHPMYSHKQHWLCTYVYLCEYLDSKRKIYVISEGK